MKGKGRKGKRGEDERREGKGVLLNLKSHVDELKGYTEDNLNRLLVVKPGAM